MSETKTYIIVYDEKKKLYRLVPPAGRVIRIKKDHKKFEWVQQQEAGKVVKINATDRWTSSKDYDGLYEQIQADSKPVSNTKKAPTAAGVRAVELTLKYVNNSITLQQETIDKSGITAKSKKWPLEEKINCKACNGTGKITTQTQKKSGFLGLKKTIIYNETPCEACVGKGANTTLAYPYKHDSHLVKTVHKLNLNFDELLVIMVDELITETEFKDYKVYDVIMNNCFHVIEKAFQNDYNKQPGTGSRPILENATWADIKKQCGAKGEDNLYWDFEIVKTTESTQGIFSDHESFKDMIKQLIKHDIIEPGKKRRSVKDYNDYYRLTKNAKKVYKSLA